MIQLTEQDRAIIRQYMVNVSLEAAGVQQVGGDQWRVEYQDGAGVASSGTPAFGDIIALYVREAQDPQPSVNGQTFVVDTKWIGTGTPDILYHKDDKPGGLAKDRVIRNVDGMAFLVTSVDASMPGVVICDLEVTP